MKKLSFLVLFALISLVASAQSKVIWSAHVGGGISNITGDDSEGAKSKFAYKIGVGLECPFDQTWSLQTGLNYVSKGAKTDEYAYDDAIVQNKINALYLELPVMAAARFPVANSTRIVVSAGPYLAYGIGGKSKQEAKSGGQKITIEEDTFGDDALRRFDYGIGAGVAAEFGGFVLGLNSQFGLANLAKDTKAKNFSLFLTLGCKF